MPQPLVWNPVKKIGNIEPTPRSGHTLIPIGKTYVLYGGFSREKDEKNEKKDQKLLPSNQVYTLRVSPNYTCDWKLIQCSGDAPLPRTNHAACAISQDKMLIFGGLYTSNQRFNDTYILRTTNFNWSQPPNQKSGTEPKNAESKIGAPEPRCNHTITYVKDKNQAFVFGGHGGVSYQRKAFNDLYALNCDTYEWTKVEAEGAPPDARGGHTAALYDNKIFIFGGWTFNNQYSNIMIYEVEKNAWTDPEMQYDIPRWNHCGVMVEAIPSWKYFIFGGSVGAFDEGQPRNLGKFTDDTHVLDMDSRKWNVVNLETTGNLPAFKPKARDSAQMYYDAGESRLVLFGGWSNNWLGDIFALNVSTITGPPYAIFKVSPELGPYTGKTKITIAGVGFFQSADTTVTFICGKIQKSQTGFYISETEMYCETPSFEDVGPKECEIRVAMGKGDNTTTFVKFNFFLNTKADRTLAYGPGLLPNNPVGIETVFYIQARNLIGENRKSGADEFEVRIIKQSPDGEEPKEIQCQINDLGTGSYEIKYLVEEEGEVSVDIRYKNEHGEKEKIRGAPYKAATFSAKADPKNVDITGPGVSAHIQRQIAEMDEFISETRANISIKGKNLSEDVYALLKVQENLLRTAERKEDLLLNIDILDQMLAHLEGKDIPKDNEIKKNSRLKEDLESLQKNSGIIEKEITPYVKQESEKTKANIKKFEEELKSYYSDLKKESFNEFKTGIEGALKRLDEVNLDIAAFEKRVQDYEYFSQMFKFPEDVLPVNKALEQIKVDVNAIIKLWSHTKKCDGILEGYKKLEWGKIETADMDEEINKKLRKELNDLRNIDKKSTAFTGIQKYLKNWADFVPLVGELKDPSMQTADMRHWKNVQKITKANFEINDETPLQVVWDLNLFNVKEDIEEITERAKQEAKMEKQLTKVEEKWKETVFEKIPHKDTAIITLKMTEEDFETLEEHNLQISNMQNQKYNEHFEAEITKWHEDLGAINEVIQLLAEVQKTWSFLENLFIHSEEVKKELPEQSEKFVGIDKEVKLIMASGVDILNILKFCVQPKISDRLEEVKKDLQVCEKALNDFLDGKRKAFPRFYFVSVTDLLDILSNGNNPNKINKHMSKIFQAIDRLDLKDNAGGGRPQAAGMHSGVGKEYVGFDKPLTLNGKVEVYLTETVDKMKEQLNSIASKSFQTFANYKREDWIKKDAAQITILVNMIIWVANVESALMKVQNGQLEAMKKFFEESVENLTALIKMVQGDLDKALRQKIMVLITMDTHSRDVVDRLINENVRKVDEFQWQSQLKFYWDTTKNDCKTCIADATLWYGYEYLGNGPRLVITPLTDRIYVTATQALHLCMGCAPAGPAGTGKTETTKDLASAVGKACYVFNCSSEMNYESMGNIFKGLAASGCWGCFDEFNRLLPEVLSVCSVQFKSVTDAIKTKKKRFELQGDEIDLDPSCGVFITMNPGYLGRAELPEGLKSLFRPITVVVPDLELICENMLMAEGFIDAKVLATKFTVLYSLCRDLLSKADHYDWGLRAIKSVLVVAGAFKRAEPKISEGALLMRALRDFNLPKIVAEDLEIFSGLLNDLFPGVDIPRKRDLEFEAIIEKASIESKLFPEEVFILKVVQLSELLEIRHCVFVMGPPGAGKSSVWKTLAKAQDKAGKKTLAVDLNPKVVSTRDLYGYVTPAKEWKDGLLSKTMRTLGEYQDTNPKWILLDGDLDANWIESMNSVMDDNKILTLASNERIPLKPHMRMIFEIRDLKFATPATVSRAGILYISDEGGAQWKSYVKSWIANNLQDEQLKVNIQKLFDRYVEHSLLFIRRNCKFLLPVSPMAMVISLCKGLQPLLSEKYSNLEYTFAYVAVWALGGALAEKDGHNYRKDFSSFFKNEFKSVKWPTKGTVFDYFVDNLENGVKLEEWEKQVQAVPYETSIPMQSVTVPTPESVSLTEFMNNFILVGHPVLLIGMAGGGKTQLCKGVLKEINNVVKKKKLADQFMYTTINFNYYTDSTYLQNMLEQPLEKKAGKQFGPPGKSRLIYFIDDLNMPQLDPYNTQTAISLLRQHADYLHWYDVSKLTIKEIINTQSIAAMNPTAGSFSVDPRYQRHFWTCSVPFPDNNSLFIIFSTFLNGHFQKFKQNVQEQSKPIITATLQLHQQICSLFKKTAFEFHYEFNIRHIAGIFQGLLMAAPTLPAQYGQPPASFSDDKIVMLWVHEAERVYGDRLVRMEHLEKFKNALSDIAKKNFPKVPLNKHLGPNSEALIFCNFPLGIQSDRYLDKIDLKTLEERVNEALKDYNDNYAVMDLVLFEDAMRHVTKITRIISQPSGHALLVGVGGSGKQSLARLASHICQFSTFQITISQSYGMNELKQDLTSLYTKTGMKDEGILFLFTDGQITNERFLVYINDLLSSGEVADLYAPEDKDNIINQIRPKVKSAGQQDTRENCWNYYIDRVKANLHMALCFSPVGEGLRRRARQFPALVNSTVIDWFQPWPKQALRNVAASFLKEVDFIPEAIKENVIDFMPYSFERVNKASEEMLMKERRYVYTTPKSFLELIKLFKTMLNRKKDQLENGKGRYQLGLEKLQETASSVSQLEKELQVMQVEVEAKKAEADKVAEVVGKEKEKVMKETDKANVEADKASQIKQEVEIQKASTEKDLNDALPLKEKAKMALQDISTKDFQFLKGLNNPPADVAMVCNTCIHLLAGVEFNPNVQVEVDKNKKPKSVDWKQYLKLLKNPGSFKEVLMEIPKLIEDNKIPAHNINPIRTYLNETNFKPEIMKDKSLAAMGICSYIINIVQYFDVISIILPKQKALVDATELLSSATEKVEKLNAIVAELQAQLAEKEAEYNKAMGEKNAAEAEANRCQMRLGLAQRLVNALGSENERWAKSIEDITKSLEVLVGDVILGSSFVSYAGPFVKKYREAIIRDFLKWLKERKIPMSPNSDPLLLLTSEALKAEWNQQGLPPDIVSIENGTILVNSERYSLIIDPQLQGISWIKEKEKKHNLQVTRLGNRTLVTTLELAIENGHSVLLENLDEQIDATLNPIIARNTFKRGKNRILKFGGKDLSLHENFRLFMHTKLANPHYPPEIQAEATLINFTVTEDGLGDQLLNLVVGKERPDLASKKIKLIKQQNEFKITLKRLEEELLFKLTNAQGDILSDIALIENLETSKKISIEIAEKVIIAKATEKIINEASEAYRTVATRGALIFFLMNDLYKIHTFYMYSLESFVIVVNRAIDSLVDPKAKKEAPKKEEGHEKQEEIKEEGGEGEKKAEGEGEEKKAEEEEKKDEGEEKKAEGEDAAAEDDKRSQKSGGAGDAKSQKGDEPEKAQEDDDGEISNAPIDKKRVEKITERITECAYHYMRRGLFEKHKLIVASMLCLRILERHKDDKVRLPTEEINHLVTGKIDTNPPPIPESVKSWVNENIWQACCALETLPYFKDVFLKSMCEQDSLQWRKWYSEEKAELADLPKSFKELEAFPRLLLLRAMRPDRMSSALTYFVKEKMGSFFTEQPPFSIDEVYGETTNAIPIFFVLFPGVDPTPDVEKVGLKCGISKDNNKFENISMGQGQDKRATDALFKAAKEGTWIMLQNVHLMQGWLKSFERSLETASQSAHPNFRCFISSEPPPLPDMKIIPESLLQNCIKVSNEAPQDLKANLRRAYAKFDQETIAHSGKQPEFKAILFALCMFHSLVLGRKKFGSQGWSRVYNFNDGDLTICADVLHNYLEKYEQVPYADLRYIYGEIMYGGHITDNWDRRTNATYLEKLIRPELLNKEFRLVPGLVNPDANKNDYESYRKYIEEKLPIESPQIFGMHSNAEIGFLSELCAAIFNTITDVQGGSAGSSGAKSGDGDTLDKISKYKERLPKGYIILDIEAKIKEKFKEVSPYVVVSLQECTRMNGLLAEIDRSLEELRRGLTGELNMTDTMEALALALTLNRVPADWGKYPSKKGLASWFSDLLERTAQLHEWTSEMIIPKSLWISGLFNPMSFLTAIMQVTARAKGLPLDEMVLQTNVMGFKTPEELPGYAENGFYVHGLYLEGAGWELGGGGADGYLTEAKLKDLHPRLPIVNVISVLKKDKKVIGQYQCPTYVTSLRGATYVFTANLQMESDETDARDWILAGVALLMSDD